MHGPLAQTGFQVLLRLVGYGKLFLVRASGHQVVVIGVLGWKFSMQVPLMLYEPPGTKQYSVKR